METLREHTQVIDGFVVNALVPSLPPGAAPFLAIRPQRRPPALTSEHDEQVTLVGWMRRKKLLVWAVPNEGKRTSQESAARKREGLVKGAADLMWEVPGLPVTAAMEMKKAHGTLSDIRAEQATFLSRRAALGKPAVVLFGYKAGQFFVENFEAIFEFQLSLRP